MEYDKEEILHRMYVRDRNGRFASTGFGSSVVRGMKSFDSSVNKMAKEVDDGIDSISGKKRNRYKKGSGEKGSDDDFNKATKLIDDIQTGRSKNMTISEMSKKLGISDDDLNDAIYLTGHDPVNPYDKKSVLQNDIINGKVKNMSDYEISKKYGDMSSEDIVQARKNVSDYEKRKEKLLNDERSKKELQELEDIESRENRDLKRENSINNKLDAMSPEERTKTINDLHEIDRKEITKQSKGYKCKHQSVQEMVDIIERNDMAELASGDVRRNVKSKIRKMSDNELSELTKYFSTTQADLGDLFSGYVQDAKYNIQREAIMNSKSKNLNTSEKILKGFYYLDNVFDPLTLANNTIDTVKKKK